jgi:hypothetical protein
MGCYNDSYESRVTGRNPLWYKRQFSLSSVQTGFRRTLPFVLRIPPKESAALKRAMAQTTGHVAIQGELLVRMGHLE